MRGILRPLVKRQTPVLWWLLGATAWLLGKLGRTAAQAAVHATRWYHTVVHDMSYAAASRKPRDAPRRSRRLKAWQERAPYQRTSGNTF